MTPVVKSQLRSKPVNERYGRFRHLTSFGDGLGLQCRLIGKCLLATPPEAEEEMYVTE